MTDNISETIKNIIIDFKGMNSWEDKYKHLIELGKDLPPMEENFRSEKNLVKGCQSRVWFHVNLKDGRLYFQGDSDAAIVKGLVALLLKVYSGRTPDEILSTKPTFLGDIGLREHLSMSRSNGLSSMLKQISLYAIAFKSQL
jgi:cysteine desulfuration protein SufE